MIDEVPTNEQERIEAIATELAGLFMAQIMENERSKTENKKNCNGKTKNNSN